MNIIQDLLHFSQLGQLDYNKLNDFKKIHTFLKSQYGESLTLSNLILSIPENVYPNDGLIPSNPISSDSNRILYASGKIQENKNYLNNSFFHNILNIIFSYILVQIHKNKEFPDIAYKQTFTGFINSSMLNKDCFRVWCADLDRYDSPLSTEHNTFMPYMQFVGSKHLKCLNYAAREHLAKLVLTNAVKYSTINVTERISVGGGARTKTNDLYGTDVSFQLMIGIVFNNCPANWYVRLLNTITNHEAFVNSVKLKATMTGMVSTLFDCRRQNRDYYTKADYTEIINGIRKNSKFTSYINIMLSSQSTRSMLDMDSVEDVDMDSALRDVFLFRKTVDGYVCPFSDPYSVFREISNYFVSTKYGIDKIFKVLSFIDTLVDDDYNYYSYNSNVGNVVDAMHAHLSNAENIELFNASLCDVDVIQQLYDALDSRMIFLVNNTNTSHSKFESLYGKSKNDPILNFIQSTITYSLMLAEERKNGKSTS